MKPIPSALYLILWGALAVPIATAHQGHSHSPAPVAPPPIAQSSKIAQSYRERIQPLFERTCFDCHSSKTRYPWYASLPLVRRLIASDIAEGREHLDFEGGYPFKSHATPLEDLQAIREEIEKNEMPPARYRWLHAGAQLTDEERQRIVAWTRESERLLSGAGASGSAP